MCHFLPKRPLSRRAPLTGMALLCLVLFVPPPSGARGRDLVSSGTESTTRPPDSSPAESGTSRYLRLLRERKEGRHDEVISACRRVLEQDVRAVWAYRLLVEAAAEKGRLSLTARDVAEALEFMRNLEADAPSEASRSYGLGLGYKRLNDLPQARLCLRRSISSGATFWDAYEELLTSYETKEDIEESGAFFRSEAERRPDNPFLAQAAGVTHLYLCNFKEALAEMDKAVRLHRRSQDGLAESQCLFWMSYAAMYANDYPSSLRWAEEGLRLARECGERVQEAACLELRSFIRIDLGNYPRALEDCLKALSLLREAPESRVENVCRRTLGVVQLEMGNLAAARQNLEMSLKGYEAERDWRGQGVCLYWLTLLHRERGDFSRAMDYAKQALWISRRIGFKTGEAFHLTTIGDIYLALGDYARALDFNKQALEVTEQYVSKWSREGCLNTIGSVYLELHDYGQALDYFERALDHIQAIGHKREEARCLYNIGVAHLLARDYAGGQIYFSRSLRAAELNGNRLIVAFNHNRLGALNRVQGRSAAARSHHERALAIGREIGQPTIVWEALAGLGAVSADGRKFDEAIAFYKKAVDIVEDIRHLLPLREYSSGFFRSKISLYEELVNALYERHLSHPDGGFAEECFSYAERAKARSFLDDLQRAKIDLDSASLGAEKKERLDILSRQISRLLAELNRASAEPRARLALLEELEKAEDEFREMVEAARRESPEGPGPLLRTPSPFSEIQARLLEEKTALIEYFVGEENIFVFLLTPRGLRSGRIGAPRSRELLELAQNYVQLLSSKEIDETDCVFAGRRLGGLLLAPCGDLPAEVENLIIIPDRNLCYLPFEALVLPEGGPKEEGRAGRFLLERYEISYAPSASALLQIMDGGGRTTPSRELLAVGDPFCPSLSADSTAGPESTPLAQQYYLDNRFFVYPLPFASKEMQSISRFFRKEKRTVLSKGQATEVNVKRQPLADFEIVHFATHGLLDERAASRSALVLTPDGNSEEDGFLQAKEVYDLSLNAGLVVLSACQTARGKIEKGDGVQGIARAFFCAGTKSVLASLWDINDKSTALFMESFYDFLTQGRSKKQALRLAKIRMSKSRHYRPYHWAGFVLFGDGESSLSVRRPPLWRRILAF